MISSVYRLISNNWKIHTENTLLNPEAPQLVLCFGKKELLFEDAAYQSIKLKFPYAEIALCSSAGEIFQDTVSDDTIVAAALQFDTTRIKTAAVNICNFSNSYEATKNLVAKLPKEDLLYIMILSDGNLVNGSELVKGLNEASGNKVLVTGGLAGDGSNFRSTVVGLNQSPKEGNIIAIGFYGKNLIITHGCQGGWEYFGLEKRITKSKANVLFEIENQNALELYKKYLGAEAEQLPGAALLFPLSVTIPGTLNPVVRTILSISEEEKTMTFAGDVPEGSKVRFMKADFNKITSAASIAATQSLLKPDHKPDFALLISCVGRKLILGAKSVEEVAVVKDVFSEETNIAGFYSYGEISPFKEGEACQLHNQTMTITSFYEL